MSIKLSEYEKVLDLNITPNQHFLLGIIDSKNKVLFQKFASIEREDKFTNDLYLLWTKGYIEGFDEKNYLINFDNLKVVKLKDTNNIPTEDPFYMECYELFPKGVKTGGQQPVRSDKKEFVKKFQRFEKEYPQFDRTLIKKAFEYYIEELRKQNYAYMSTAGYFIFKQDVHKGEKSILSVTCQYLLDNPEDNDKRRGAFTSI